MLVGLEGVLLVGGAGGGHTGEEGQAHAEGGAAPGVAELGEEEGFGDDEEVMVRAAGGQEDRGPVGVVVPGGSYWLQGHVSSFPACGPVGSLPVFSTAPPP